LKRARCSVHASLAMSFAPPLRVAVTGAGPSGLAVAGALIREAPEGVVDVRVF